MLPFLSAIAACLLFSVPAFAEEISVKGIMRKLEAMERRMQKLEKNVQEKDKEIEALKREKEAQAKEIRALKEQKEKQDEKIDALKKETDHIKGHPRPRPGDKLERPEEAKAEQGLLEKWCNKIELSGLIEAEYSSEKRKLQDPNDKGSHDAEHNDDIIAATVELGVDAQINKYIRGHILFLWEEDEENEHVIVDEATITIGGIEETYGLYFLGGRYYPHFGELNSCLVSDPLTLEIFEIRETAAQIGHAGEWFSLGAGVFHGDVELHEKTRSRIQNFFVDANFHNPEDTLGGLSLLAGVSYMSNVADTDTLQGQVVDSNGDGSPNDLENFADALALYVKAEYWKFIFGAEYITALDSFAPGKMAYAVDRWGMPVRTRPAAWNFELAFRPIDPLQLAIRYEGSSDMFALFPEHRYGGSVSWEFLKYTTLSAEYLHGEYDKDNQNADGMVEDESDTFTVQMAIEFP
jgi:hypothetical protein